MADKTGLDLETIQRALQQLQVRDIVLLDESGEAITDAYPFTESATPHRVHLRGHALHAMCAIDALGAGAMYGKDIAIESACRQCKRPIAIETRDRGLALETVVPGKTVVWAGLRYANKCAATSLCQVLAFFCSDEHLEAWRRVNAPNADDGVRLTLAEAMQVGKAHFMPAMVLGSDDDGNDTRLLQEQR